MVKDSSNGAWRPIRGLATGVTTLVLGGALIAVLRTHGITVAYDTLP